MTVAEARDLLAYDEWANARLFRTLAALSEEQYTRPVTSSFSSLRDTFAGDLLRHVVNHSTYHRGQAATLLRQVGAVAPETDFVVYRESGA
jgi:uncharacterized damage-inducible protein DinB